MASGKGQTLCTELLGRNLDNATSDTTSTPNGNRAQDLLFVLGTGASPSDLGLQTYNSDLGEAAMAATAGWAIDPITGADGGQAENETAITWTNNTVSTITVNEIAIYRVTGRDVGDLLYWGGNLNGGSGYAVGGSGGTITAAADGLLVTEA